LFNSREGVRYFEVHGIPDKMQKLVAVVILWLRLGEEQNKVARSMKIMRCNATS